ncbi:MAG: hypothetical protein OXG42_06405, partial [Chloroflexi bacterium]|nr:hypothetical protein [Chloroflexota bacterium]
MSAEELFQHAELSSVERMTKWGDDATIASVVSRHSEWMHSGWHVGPGDSLWLFLERETTLQPFWLGEDDHSGVTHALRAGVNSVYWSGQSDSVLSDVAASLPAGPIVIGAFDSSSQQFEWFSIRGTAEHRQRTTLNISYGDVIIVYSAHPAEWTQPYRMQANLIFGADVPYDDRQVFAAQLAELEQALTNRFGLPSVTFDFYLARTWDGLYDAFESQGLGPYSTEQRVTGNHCANPGGPPHWIIGAHCRSRPNPADSSFVQGHLRALGVPYGNRLSSAMQLGFAAYVRRALLDSDLALA